MKWIEDGPRETNIILVGESPSEAEVVDGHPFAGGSGYMLQHMLSVAGISMSQCFRTYVVHVPAPQRKFDSFYKQAHMLPYLMGVARLKQVIGEIKPNLVIGLGGGALKALTGKVGIDKWRGSILESTLVPSQKVICTYSHGFALQVYQSKAVIETDFARCAADAKFPELNYPQRQLIVAPDGAVAMRIAAEMRQAEWLAVDIECSFNEKTDDWHLTCVGFSDRPDRAMTLPWIGELNKHLIKILLESDTKKVYQNGMFDVSFLRSMGLYPKNYAYDTMHAHHCLLMESASGEDEIAALSGKKRFSVFRKGLGFQTSIYTREPYYKDDGKVSGPIKDWNSYWIYNAKDAAVTREIMDVQLGEIAKMGVAQGFETEMGLVEPLLAASSRGIKIDLEYRKLLIEDFNTKINNLQDALDRGAGRPINVKSTHANGDMQWLLYEHLKLPVKLNRATKRPTSNKDAINELAGKHQNPILHIILRLREYRDFVERYLNAEVSSDGRMRCSFDITGTKSGRLSSRAALDGTGTNLHTIPVRKKEGARLRQMFIPDEGKVFIARDYKQGETWFVAYLARCEALIELLNDGSRDIHKETAARMYNILVDQVTYEQRYLAKRTGHGSNYGLTGDKLSHMIEEDAATTGVRATPREAQGLIDRYFLLYPEIRTNFWKDVERAIQKNRRLETPLGRVRYFYDDMRSESARERLLRDAYSWIPQSSLGDLGNIATRRVYEEIELARPDLGAEYVLSVHDSVMMQCNVGHELEVAAMMEECMRIPVTIHGRTFCVPSDCQIGWNWNKRHPEMNPRGLVDSEKWNPQDEYNINLFKSE